MVTTPRFCTNCGSPLSPGSQFCTHCGIPVQASPAAPAAAAVPAPAPAPAAAEPIVGIISLQRRKGLMGMGAETFNMIVTPWRLALVFVSNQAMQEAIAVARDQARAEGKGVFGQIGAQMGWLNVLYRKYQGTPVDVLLAQSPGSFALLNQEIRSVRLHDMRDERRLTTRGEMTIEAAAGKHKFELLTMSTREARQVLQQTLGGIVR